MNVHFSSKHNDWETPFDLFEKLNKEFHFEWDLACTRENCLCAKGIYFDEGMDALKFKRWPKAGWSFCNPPYGREIGKFVKKAYEQNRTGSKIVMLIPARTDTSYWHDYIFNKAEIRFLRGRLKFGDCKNSAPFPSAVVIYK